MLTKKFNYLMKHIEIIYRLPITSIRVLDKKHEANNGSNKYEPQQISRHADALFIEYTTLG
jgi:hypothetical protein